MRRAAGHDQREGVIGRVFAVPAAIGGDRCSSALVHPHRRARLERSRRRRVARAWACSTTTSSSKGCPRRRSTRGCARRPPSASARRSTRVEPLDLSQHDLARVPAPRRRQRDHLRRAPRPAPLPRPQRAARCARELAHRHGVARASAWSSATAPAQLLSCRGLRADGRPARRARHAVAVLPAVPADGPPRPRARGPGARLRRRRRAQRGQRAHARRRAVQPERPDGRARRRPTSCGGCSRRCPSAWSCCSTRRSSTSSTRSRPTPRSSCSTTSRGCSCFRTFSKAWGLAGLRVGYALGGPGSEPLLEQLAPELGVNELAQAGALEALRSTEHARAAPRRARPRRARATAAWSCARASASRSRPARRTSSGWRPTGIDGAELARRLDRAGVRVAGGGPLGDPKPHPRLDPRRRGDGPLPARARRRAGLSFRPPRPRSWPPQPAAG